MLILIDDTGTALEFERGRCMELEVLDTETRRAYFL